MPTPTTPIVTESQDPPQRHTEAEVEALKRQWRQDPCWSLDSTVGFEAHRDELAAYEAAYWTEARQAMERAEEHSEIERELLDALIALKEVVDIIASEECEEGTRVEWWNRRTGTGWQAAIQADAAIAKAGNVQRPAAQDETNARLRSAAPELYEALMDLVAALHDATPNGPVAAGLAEARAIGVLAKITESRP